ncbi:MAG: COX15/CtaA family protein [Bacteroidota bacterium]|nr:COX15/CtaA family protein [Bacteroidota bacterium]
MNSTTSYLRYTRFVLIMVLLVIVAGAVVRMTQSGMGCPDWPTCFGRWIPPVNASQLPPDFEKYLRKQDIDHTFNVYHTWIEYMNRLLGALLGVFIFIHTIWSFRKFRNNNRSVFYISLLMLLAVGFQGWLGKKVVDANLATLKVTAHMIVALVIVVLPVLIISKIKASKVIAGRSLKALTVTTLVLVLVQIILGTRVREQIDEIASGLNYGQRNLWIGKLGQDFLIHRSFAAIVAAACVFLFIRSRSIPILARHSRVILFFMLCSFAAGLAMFFMNIPAVAQPLHLLSGVLLAISLFSYRLKMK